MGANDLLMEDLQFVKVLDPVADAFDSTPVTEVINMKNAHRVLFVVHVGVGATGSSTFTVEACDDVVPTNTSAIPFYYREILSGDTEGAITLKATTGVVDTVGSSKLILVEVREDALAASGYGFVRLKAVESVNSPVLGGIIAILESKIPGALKPTAIV